MTLGRRLFDSLDGCHGCDHHPNFPHQPSGTAPKRLKARDRWGRIVTADAQNLDLGVETTRFGPGGKCGPALLAVSAAEPVVRRPARDWRTAHKRTAPMFADDQIFTTPSA